MNITHIDIHLCNQAGKLKAFCCITFDASFVVRDIKIIEGDAGPFLAMPSRKLTDHCPRCHEKNHLKARYCNHCGLRLSEERHNVDRAAKLHADVAHPISPELRSQIEARVLEAYREAISTVSTRAKPTADFTFSLTG